MVEEARLEELDSGAAPLTEGWFVINVSDAAWLTNGAFGGRCVFEATRPVLRRRPDLDVHTFPELGATLAVIGPGQPSGLYHAETNQEDFLVLSGECVLVVEDEERPLRAWHFVHCPPGTAHVFVGAGDGPCVIFMIGRRSSDKEIVYPARSARSAAVPASRPKRAPPRRRTHHSPIGSPIGRNAGPTCRGFNEQGVGLTVRA